MKRVVLEMTGISIEFSGVYALRDMHFSLRESEVHALIGENGAGKSSLIKILGGIYKPKTGRIMVEGAEVRINDVKHAQEMGISIIHQEIILVPYQTVAENIFLARELTNNFGFKDNRRMCEETERMMAALGIDIDPTTPVWQLTIAQQQLIEIVKAVSFETRILVMDEPTSSLSESEVQILFGVIERLRERGVGVIYISHKLDEVFRIADCVTVIRDGTYIATKEIGEMEQNELIRMMVGRTIDQFYTRTYNEPGAVALEVRNLSKKGVFREISFTVRNREIVGFAGLVGAGRSEIMMCLFGGDTYDGGQILLGGVETRFRSTKEAIKNGIGFVPENRKQQGLILENSAGFNITLASINSIVRHGLLNEKLAESLINKSFNDLNIRARSARQLALELSGGNQQKLVLSKWLATDPKILILDEPTKGIDVGAKAEIYAIMNRLASSGMAILMVSSELPEIISICDRVYVLHSGQIAGELQRRDFSQAKIMQYATGKGE
jgi:ABC-type sugar transport system ATPase subunit